MLSQEYVYDEYLTRQYIERELKKIELERKKVLGEYNNLISEFSNYKKSITSIFNNYKESYEKVKDIGTISSDPIKDSEKLLEASKDIEELFFSVDDLIVQIKLLIEKYETQYKEDVLRIKSHREYRLSKGKEELQ